MEADSTTKMSARELLLDLIGRVQRARHIGDTLSIRDIFHSEEWQRALQDIENEAPSIEIERRNIDRLAGILEASGWLVEREVKINQRAFRVDLLVTHPDISSWGHIEVKDSVGPIAKDYVDAVKQAADYVGQRTADGRVVEWGAVYPVRYAHLWSASRADCWRNERQIHAPTLEFMSGVFELASKQLKVHAMYHTPRSDMPRGDAVTIMYLNRHLIWREGKGKGRESDFSANAESYLCGKRQTGGQRL